MLIKVAEGIAYDESEILSIEQNGTSVITFLKSGLSYTRLETTIEQVLKGATNGG